MDSVIDMHQPLVSQVMRLDKKSYLEWISTPFLFSDERKSAKLFHSPFLESLTHTKWWAVPLVWLPVCMLAWLPYIHAAQLSSSAVSWYRFGHLPVVSLIAPPLLYFCVGVLVWTLVEYLLHRFLFHGHVYAPDTPLSVGLQFLLHGVHHKLPMDETRLVMPPALLAVLASLVYIAMRPVFAPAPDPVYNAVFGSGLAAYVAYDVFHYAHHHVTATPGTYFGFMKRYHLKHHFAGIEGVAFGVTSTLWDKLLGTELPLSPPPEKPTAGTS